MENTILYLYLMSIVPTLTYGLIELFFLKKHLNLKGYDFKKIDMDFHILDDFILISLDCVKWRKIKKPSKILEVISYIPIVNIFFFLFKIIKLNKRYNIIKNKDNILKNNNKKVDIRDNSSKEKITLTDKKIYFIGYYHASRSINIFFNYDGNYLTIIKDSAKEILAMNEEEQKEVLLYLLYLVYSGYDGVEINHSYNIKEVFDKKLISTMVDFFKENNNVHVPSTITNFSCADIIRKRIR